ncbi:MAG: acetyl-CoA carboxylase biotin carboxyl carrier protein subunit [candidate division Zixibacteria bacterium]|nr:acetyl-CoA carboxylase biotin carboxyl carrier protein subunit [candidate division Zixibacteria bacterium]NIR62497.1 acetyl-CoA carboxylase biotin carboxyl carrier protein subunit [candidate division Zixibacteria bacterium]NIS15203.1 acetyl-CoA carboxylase biotin carboxyl carrier protein subunit [candidate division Zixibacteria bacterium]NIS44634.1 acetyl-CoA carboxylase biotin carboxyl carrier protein subunit [candidate division Zixibacteria bacterium]NIT51719.1 acetyl-CoA carboxylase bioti
MDYQVKIEDREYIVTIDPATHPPQIKVDGVPVETKFSTRSDNSEIQLLMDNRSYDIEVVKQKGRQNGDFSVFIYGREFSLYAEDERLAKIREVAGLGPGGDTRKELHAPMPGLVTKVLKNPGDQVSRGESLIIVEAMKMENELKSLIDGTIKEIKVKEGQSVDKNALMVLFE